MNKVKYIKYLYNLFYNVNMKIINHMLIIYLIIQHIDYYKKIKNKQQHIHLIKIKNSKQN